ncbi:hypothetical protein HIM_04135 [Hirsutella minnesotensis 3608]|uniref:Amidase domain-containing protein n=1 Tax=Hirsutella minnesotensis 3608 TaxID=1043627 RepID=A0A0F7ZLH2_9HYPO|nr:hypothetical protein HIM_04135 [Hirsutella minnesotensis 3608]
MVRIALLIASAASVAAANAGIVFTGASVTLNDVDYFVSPISQGRAQDGPYNLSAVDQTLQFVPVTVVAHHETNLQAMFNNWTAQDDVWQSGFQNMILMAGYDNSASQLNTAYRADSPSMVLPLENTQIPQGPYFLNSLTGNLHQAFRLYEDFAGAFIQSLIQLPEGSFQTLSAQIPASVSSTIGVPSRLYFTPTKEKPLAGKRFGVKDIFDLAGVKRSNGNRAWYKLYPAANETAPVVRNLVEAGAIVVGVQKTSQFANGEKPTADWVDYHAPFNPRADGYQDTSASSAGGAVSIATYDWLDFALGSDTGDSIRKPANLQGIFGNRPSHGLVSLSHAMSLSPSLDTAGIMTRDPVIWDLASAALYRSNYSSFSHRNPRYPTTVYFLGSPATNSSVNRLVNSFSQKLARFLNTTVTPLYIQKEWETSGPENVNMLDLADWLNTTYATIIGKDQTRLLRDPFYEDYAAAHDGRRPFVNPGPLARWAFADSLPDNALEQAIANKTIFKTWFNKEILPPSTDPTECSSSLILYTQSNGKPDYRDQYGEPPEAPSVVRNEDISGFSEIPDGVFPIGEVPFFSSVTNHTEFLPVTIDVMVAKGCDGLLARLAKDLVDARILKTPQTGSGISGGEILLRRDKFYYHKRSA